MERSGSGCDLGLWPIRMDTCFSMCFSKSALIALISNPHFIPGVVRDSRAHRALGARRSCIWSLGMVPRCQHIPRSRFGQLSAPS